MNFAGFPSIVGLGQSAAPTALSAWPGPIRKPVAAKKGRDGAGAGSGADGATDAVAEGGAAAGNGSNESAMATPIRSKSADCASG
jgi:hypothetical protein